ncbi:hypothetical protein [Treponema pedis]|uniref:Lipoprotein n=1 Tax=Treponema pedis str. T A4 TaxID=1291379 RepID=S6A344_9SPIR|nr:hypothetical protein [Treponema pedis]AGT43226.1 hypothetical protein TPE_0730 [Treponema pedis str. T A4]
MSKKALFVFYAVAVIFFGAGCKVLLGENNLGATVAVFIPGSQGSSQERLIEMPSLSDTDIEITLKDSLGHEHKGNAGSAVNGAVIFNGIPLGETVITVKVSALMCSWEGVTEYNVKEDNNNIVVKISKTANRLSLLLPIKNESYGAEKASLYAAENPYSLNARTEIIKGSSYLGVNQQYIADRYGRLYYIDGTAVKRIKADGSLDEGFTVDGVTSPFKLYYDSRSDRLFIADNTSVIKYIQFGKNEEDEDVTAKDFGQLSGTSISADDLIAVENNRFFLIKRDKVTSYSTNGVVLTVSAENEKIKDKAGTEGRLTDVLIFNGNIYILISQFDEDTEHSRGALTVLPVNFDGNSGLLEYGFTANKYPASDEAASCFFNPVKFLGRRNGLIYIADDGFNIIDSGGHQIFKNINRLGVFNAGASALSFIDLEDTEWLNKAETSSSGGGAGSSSGGKNIIIWESDGKEAFNFYAAKPEELTIESAWDSLYQSNNGKKASDVFCFDKNGNFYLVVKQGSNKTVVRYKYDNAAKTYTESGKRQINKTGTEPIMDIAIDDGNPSECRFYYITHKNSKVTLFMEDRTWDNSDESSFAKTNVSSSEKTLDGLPSGSNIRSSAIAVTDNALYVSWEGTHVIFIRKYTKSGTNFTPPAKTQQITGVNSDGGVIRLNDIKYLNSELYVAVSIINDSYQNAKNIYGKMYKVKDGALIDSNEALSAGSDFTIAHSSYSTSGEDNVFAPIRFINWNEAGKFGVVSDGFYKTVSISEQKNKIFVLGSVMEKKETSAEFSKKLAGNEFK